MTQVTLSRGATSVDIELIEESGEQLLSTSFGKPEVNIRQNGGTLSPRVQDQWSGVENYQLVGKLFDYQTAHDLADLVKSASGTPLELEIPNPAYPDVVEVAAGAGQEGALGLSFPAGRRDLVDVTLSLTRVGETNAAFEQPATTPTTTGSGPVTVSASGTTVTLPSAGLSLERSVGRPKDVVRRQPRTADPRYEAKAKVASDVFTFSFDTLDNISDTLNALTNSIFREQLGRDGVTVNFNGLLGLGSFEAIPTGSSPFRQVHQSGQDWVSSPSLEFTRIYDTASG